MLRGQKDKTEAIKAYEMSITLVCCVLSFRYAVILKPPLLFLKPPLLFLKPPLHVPGYGEPCLNLAGKSV
jgi:hypothetical protein